MVENVLLNKFLDQLSETVPLFRWRLDGRCLRAVRAVKPRACLPKNSPRCFCPITAVYCLKTHACVWPSEVFDVADEEMGLRSVSYWIAEAADGREGKLRRQMLKAVGLEN